MKVGIITVSDRSSRGERKDGSGPALEAVVRDHFPACEILSAVVPDEIPAIRDTLLDYADTRSCSLILTTGGTGISVRDVTPEATRAVIERELPGFSEAMRSQSFSKTPRSILSRAVCGTRGRCLLVNLPGSPRGAAECFAIVLPAVRHALEILAGGPNDCGAEPQGS